MARSLGAGAAVTVLDVGAVPQKYVAAAREGFAVDALEPAPRCARS